MENLNRLVCKLDFDMIIFMENKTYVSYCPELDVASCGHTENHAREMLKEAISLFLEEADKMGTLEMILEETKLRKT